MFRRSFPDDYNIVKTMYVNNDNEVPQKKFFGAVKEVKEVKAGKGKFGYCSVKVSKS